MQMMMKTRSYINAVRECVLIRAAAKNLTQFGTESGTHIDGEGAAVV